MAGQGGFWRKVAGAFVEFDDEPKGRVADAAAPPPSSVADDLASAERLLRELNQGASRSGSTATSEPFPPPRGAAPPSAPLPAPPPPAAGAPAATIPSGAGFPEGVPFADLYTGARVPAVYNTAEQMLAILDGLAAMPPEACRMAVQAMDAADDRWTVADVLVDARLKVDALTAYTAQVQERAAAAAAKAEADRAAVQQNLADAETTIQQQIAALQAELAQFQADAATARARIDDELAAIKEGVSREASRVQAEIARLGRVRSFLEPMVQPAGR